VKIAAVIPVLLFAAFQDVSAPERPEKPSSTPNLDRLAARGSAVKITTSVVATDPSKRDVLQVDHFLTLRGTSHDETFVIMLASGEIYDLRVEADRKGGGKAVLRLPDHSMIALRYSDPSKGVLSYGKNIIPVNVKSGPVRPQLTTDGGKTLRASLPESGRQLVELVDHMRGGLCRDAGLCAGYADLLFDLYRDEKEMDKVVGPDDKDDEGWTVRVLSEGRVVDPPAS
jgi:hypothetical protein